MTGIFGLLGGTFALLGAIVSFALSIVLGIYIYRDANKRNLNGTLWLLIVIVSWLVGFIVYLIVRDDETGKKQEYYQ